MGPGPVNPGGDSMTVINQPRLWDLEGSVE